MLLMQEVSLEDTAAKSKFIKWVVEQTDQKCHNNIYIIVLILESCQDHSS